MFRRALAVAALLAAMPAGAQDAFCVDAETAKKGFTITFDNGVKYVVAASDGEVVAFEEQRRGPDGRILTMRFTSQAGAVNLAVENELMRFTFTFDKPAAALVPKAVGDSVDFTYTVHIEPRSGEKRTREGTQTNSIVGAEQIVIGRCTYQAQVLMKIGRYPDEDESYSQRVLYVPELRMPVAFRNERIVKGGKPEVFTFRAAGIEGAN